MPYDKSVLHEMFRIITEYLERFDDPETPVMDYRTPQSLKERYDLTIPNAGKSYPELLKSIEWYLQHSVKTGNKRFCNQLYGGFNLPAFVGDVITCLTNTSMYTFEVAPLATLIEIELIKKMNELVRFDYGNGQFVAGDSNANLIAALCARNRHSPSIKNEGFQPTEPLVMLISEQAHYSFRKAANVLGIGRDNVLLVKSDDSGSMIPSALEKAITKALADGKAPFFIAATAGTTVLGAFDPIDEIADIAQKFDLWLHVDGAFGGSVILSRKHRALLHGIERADSFTWDPHKMMSIPLLCSVILVKDNKILKETCSCDGDEYLFHEHQHERYDLGKNSLQCGRRVDALKLWLSWRYYGDAGYEKRIDKLFDLAEHVVKIIKSTGRLELISKPQCVNICFRYLPNIKADFNDFNRKLRQSLMEQGITMMNYTFLNGVLIIRIVLVNPDVSPGDLDLMFQKLMDIAEKLENPITTNIETFHCESMNPTNTVSGFR